MKYLLLMITLCCCSRLIAQPLTAKYNTDSLLKQLSANAEIKAILVRATKTYKAAKINPQHITPDAFKIAFLEKAFLDSGWVQVKMPGDGQLSYKKKNLLSVVDFTKAGNKKRFITIDLNRNLILHNTLVSHGSASGTGADAIRGQYGNIPINDKKEVPLFFGNTEDSRRSSLGLMLTMQDTIPENLCHLCKYFLKQPHKCVVVLEGLETGINDNARSRDIVIHTTGSGDYSSPGSHAALARAIAVDPDSIPRLSNKACNCYKDNSGPASDYASACGIKENQGYIGRGLGCLVLPEESHRAILETVKEGSLIFTYSNAVPATSTHYFEESPVMQQIIAYAGGRSISAHQNISFRFIDQTELRSFSDSDCSALFGGISAIELMDPAAMGTKGSTQQSKSLFLFSDHNKGTGISYSFRLDGQTISDPQLFKRPGFIESVRYNERLKKIFYSFEDDSLTGIGYMEDKVPYVLFEEPIPSVLTSDNRGIEGLTFGSDNSLWIAFESGGGTACEKSMLPFYRVKPGIRSANYNIREKTVYEYPFDRCSCLVTGQEFNGWAGNGVSEILALKNDPGKLLVLERCFDGKKGAIRLYLASVKEGSTTLQKELVFDFGNTAAFPAKDKDFVPDNLEGMSWGNDENGDPVLYLVSDNNFSKKQKNQLIRLKMIVQ